MMMQSSNGVSVDRKWGSTFWAEIDDRATTTETVQLDATLGSIDEIANMDVEMQVPLTNQWTVVVVDTNILLEFLDVMQAFVQESERQQLQVMIMIPGVVIHELDGQKNRGGVAWLARRASTWLLKKVKERRSVKSQALDETCKSTRSWKTREAGEELGIDRTNDGLILDCCQYFSRVRECRTLLCSADKLLAVEAESVGIETVTPKLGSFCSQDMAQAVFGPAASMLQSSGPVSRHRGVEDEDGMDVDDDSAMTEFVQPSHALDVLHLQVIEHFAELLLELAGKVAGSDAGRVGGATSRHAPGYTRKEMRFWTTSDTLEFLDAHRRLPRVTPRTEVFLLRPYEGRGARRGQDWSRRDWAVVLAALRDIGETWAEAGRAVRESVPAVEAEIGRVFELALRPTGLG